jgi:hypothetical protein
VSERELKMAEILAIVMGVPMAVAIPVFVLWLWAL